MRRANQRGNEGQPVRWVHLDPGSNGYPWELPSLHPHNFPTPGMFLDLDEPGLFQIETGFDGLVRSTLGSALAMADMDTEIAMSRTSQGRKLRQQLRKVFFSKWHMALYGCTNENHCGGVHPFKPGGEGRRAIVDHVMENGRGISLMPRHAGNRVLLARGRPARRTIDTQGEGLLGAPGYSRPLLWVAAVDLDKLASSEPEVVLLEWPDGTSTAEPPRGVRLLGVQDPLALPGMPNLVGEEGEA